jgi:hypothetical protein
MLCTCTDHRAAKNASEFVGSEKAADFPEAFFVDEALRKELQE